MMLTAAALRNWFKEAFSLPHLTSGKLDASKNETAALYTGLFSTADTEKMGQQRGYHMLAIRCVMRCGVVGDTASDAAFALHERLRVYEGQVVGLAGFITLVHPEPVFIGTDSKGIFEYSIDFTLTIKEV